MRDFISFFQKEMPVPGLFSIFHLVSILLVIAVTVIVAIKFKDCTYKTYKIIIGIFYDVCLILEIIKQLVLSYHDGSFSYDFYHLPFHLCSTIYYIVPIVLFINKDKHKSLYEALIGFMSFFVLFAGIVVVLYNSIVMSERIYTNVQSMVHHGIQVALGVFLFVWNRKNINIKTFFKSLIILAIFTALAIIINMSLYEVSGGIDMFYVNPYQVSVLPVINTIHEKAGFIPYLIVYLGSVVLSGFLTYLVQMLFANHFNIKKALNIKE